MLRPLILVLKRPGGDGDARRSEDLVGACEGWSCARQKGKESPAGTSSQNPPHLPSFTARVVSERVTGACDQTDPSLGAANVIRAGGSALTKDAGGEGKVASLLDEVACTFPCNQQNNLSGVIARY